MYKGDVSSWIRSVNQYNCKAASEQGLHYFLFYLAKTHSLQILLIHYILSLQKLSIILNKKVVPNDNFKFGSERVKILNRRTCSRKTNKLRNIHSVRCIFRNVSIKITHSRSGKLCACAIFCLSPH